MATAKAQGSKVVTRVRSGKDGRGVLSVTEYYLASASSSGVTTSTSGWTTTPQTVTSTLRYLWHFTRTTYSSGTTTVDTTPHIISVFADTGLTYRFSKFVSGVEYRNDNNPYYRDANNIGYIDVVYSDEITIYSATNPPSAWICAKTNTGQALPASGASNTYWTGMNSLKPIYTALVLANRIKAKYLDVDDLSANAGFITNLVSQQAFIDELNTKSLKAKEIQTENNNGFLQMIGNVLQLFNSNGDERMKIHGGSLSSISTNSYTDPDVIKYPAVSRMFYNSDDEGTEQSATTVIATRTVSEAMILTLPQRSFSCNLTYLPIGSYSGATVAALFSVRWLVDGVSYGMNSYVLTVDPQNTNSSYSLLLPSCKVNVASGSHTISIQTSVMCFNPGSIVSGDDVYAGLSGSVLKNSISWNTSIQKVEIANTGFRIALASNVYFTVYLSGGYNYIEMRNENYGLRITNSGLYKMTNGSTWVSL